MRKIISTISISALMLSNVVGAFAQTNTIITNSGTGLDVNANSTQNTNVAVVNNNTAVVNQESKSVNISGKNDVTGNISLGTGCNPCGPSLGGAGSTIVTGASTSTTVQGVTANNNETALSLPGGTGASNNTSVVNTAKWVDVNTNATANTNVFVTNNNTAVIAQYAKDVNISGKNDVNDNIGGGNGVVTGPSTSNTLQGVTVNNNSTLVAIEPGTPGSFPCDICGFGGGQGNNTIVTNTGYKLDVNTNATSNLNVAVVNSNLLVGTQKAGSVNISGKNDVEDNIGGLSGVLTGPAMSVTTQGVLANANQTAVVIGADALPLGGDFSDIVNTGAFVDVNTNATSNTNALTANNNTSLLGQSFWGFSASGLNYSADNIGGTVTGTGVSGSGTFQNSTSNQNSTLFGSFLGLLGAWAWMGWI